MAMKKEKAVVVNEIWKDIVKGVNKVELFNNLNKNKYSFPTKQMCEQSKYNYINEAYDKCKVELTGEAVGMRATILNRYLSVYQDAIEANDRANAIKSLDSLTKLMGLNEADKIDVTSNNKLEVNIKFGVSKDKQNNEDKEDVNEE